MFQQWHRWREGQISRQDLKILMQPIRQAMEATLKEVSNLGLAKREKTPWACTVRSCRSILKVEPALWTFLDHPDVEPTNNAAVDEVFSAGVRALRPAVIHRKLSYAVQSQRVRSARVGFSP
jgi:transposase